MILGTRCIYGHWVLGFWRTVWPVTIAGRRIGFICDRHAAELWEHRRHAA